MSEKNVDLVRKAIEAWNQREPDLWRRFGSPEIEWTPSGPAALERAVYRGYDEVASALGAVWETWEEFHAEESEVRDLGDSVLWLGHVKVRGRTSGVALDQEYAVHSVVRGGKITKLHTFLSWREGVDAAGLAD